MTARPAFLKQSAHHTARLSELHAALEESANRRSGPGAYEPPTLAFDATCGCSAKRERDDTWTWSKADCKGRIVTGYESTREDYCGCGECRCPVGLGKTVELAVAELREQEAEREEA
jgi:hypothetical protein